MSSKNQPNTMTKMRVLFADDELPAREKDLADWEELVHRVKNNLATVISLCEHAFVFGHRDCLK